MVEPQAAIERALDALNTWEAYIPCEGVQGVDPEVNLLDLRERNKLEQYEIRYCPSTYPATTEGRKKLLTHIQRIALKYGTTLTIKADGRLVCNRGRIYQARRKAKKERKEKPKDFDEHGVQTNIRQHTFHHDRLNNRKKGRIESRGTVTFKPLCKTDTCKMSLKINIYNQNEPDGFLYVSKRAGSAIHSKHPKPNDGVLARPKRLLNDRQTGLLRSGNEAAVQGSAMRKVLLEHQDTFVSKSTQRSVVQCVPTFLQSNQGSGDSSAAALMNWLRKMAADPNSLLCYKVLSYHGQSGGYLFKNPKGRPLKGAARRSGTDIARNMEFQDTIRTQGDVDVDTGTDGIADFDTGTGTNGIDQNGNLDVEDTGAERGDVATHNDTGTDGIDQNDKHNVGSTEQPGLYTSHNIGVANGSATPALEVTERVPNVTATYEQLLEQGQERERRLESYRLSKLRVMVGAAWMRREDLLKFLRFPEVLFIDATHKSNNEGRPLLLICGRDSNGKVFVVLRILMPNETASFYRWVFLDLLPSMLGKDNLKRVVLTLTDGDAQEFNAVDEAIFRYINKTLRGRCMQHILEKSYEKDGPLDSDFNEKAKGKAIALEVKRWVRSWSNGESCGLDSQYHLSKQLLLSELNNNAVVRQTLGDVAIRKLVRWIQHSILDHELQYAFYRKLYIRCFDEYVTNATEGMNYAAKHSAMSAKPSDSLATAAKAMHSHEDIKSREFQHQIAKKVSSTPLYIQDGVGHDASCLGRLTRVCQDLLIQQYSQKNKYTVVRVSAYQFLVGRDQAVAFRPENCPDAFKGRPKFREIHVVELKEASRGNWVLVCSCGYKHRYGILCRHLFSIEDEYDLADIACRWQLMYAAHAYAPGKTDITKAYINAIAADHNGIRVKDVSKFLPIAAGCQLPFRIKGKLTVGTVIRIHESTIPICWNYVLSEMPSVGKSNANHLFTQESVVDLGESDDAEAPVVFEGDSLSAVRTTASKQEMDAMITTRFKEIQQQCTSLEAKEALLNHLKSLDANLFMSQIASMNQTQSARYFGNGDQEFLSFHLPLDNAKKSQQNTYKRTSKKK